MNYYTTYGYFYWSFFWSFFLLISQLFKFSFQTDYLIHTNSSDLTSYFLEDRYTIKLNENKWCFLSHKNIINDRKKGRKQTLHKTIKRKRIIRPFGSHTKKSFWCSTLPLILCLSLSLQSLSWQEFLGIKESICFPFRHIMRFRRLHYPPTHTHKTQSAHSPLYPELHTNLIIQLHSLHVPALSK